MRLRGDELFPQQGQFHPGTRLLSGALPPSSGHLKGSCLSLLQTLRDRKHVGTPVYRFVGRFPVGRWRPIRRRLLPNSADANEFSHLVLLRHARPDLGSHQNCLHPTGINRGRAGSFLLETRQGVPARYVFGHMRRKVYAMKKFGAFALLLSVALFTLGCEKPKDKAPAPADTGAPAETPPADDAGGEVK